jgi:hypothetical protein
MYRRLVGVLDARRARCHALPYRLHMERLVRRVIAKVRVRVRDEMRSVLDLGLPLSAPDYRPAMAAAPSKRARGSTRIASWSRPWILIIAARLLCWCEFMPSSLLSRLSTVRPQLWCLPVRCSNLIGSAERKPLGLNSIHSQTPSGPLEGASGSRLPPDEFHRTASRHVLRGILRECTYLPDQFAASWIRQHALSRFRTYEARNKAHAGDETYEKRLETIRRKSRQAMYQLRRANEGDRKMLMKALSMAYGRIGKRRRELLKPLLSIKETKPDQNTTTKGNAGEVIDDLTNPSTLAGPSATSLSNFGNNSSKARITGPVKARVKAYINDLPAEIRALVQGQIAASPPAIARRNPRRLSVEIPELNTWMKPMPKVRVENQLSNWYANLLSTVQPPLPDKEWDHLRDLALGVSQAPPPIPRRTNPTAPLSILEMVVTRGKLPDNLFRKDYAHNIGQRFMQRLWAEVFSQCPLMKYDSSSDKWNVIWGHHVLHDTRTDPTGDAANTPHETKDAR